jgi:hypothetical protein
LRSGSGDFMSRSQTNLRKSYKENKRKENEIKDKLEFIDDYL